MKSRHVLRENIALVITVPLLLFASWSIYRVLQRQSDISKHPIIKSISRYGPPDIARQIDIELGPDVTKHGKVAVPPSWLLLPTFFGLSVCHVPDIIWAYKKVTKHAWNFIPTGKSYAVLMWDRYGISLELTTTSEKADSILHSLAERLPWAVFGFTEELRQIVNGNWASVVAAVDARRGEVRV